MMIYMQLELFDGSYQVLFQTSDPTQYVYDDDDDGIELLMLYATLGDLEAAPEV